MNLTATRAALANFSRHPRAQTAMRWGRRGLAVAVLCLLIWQIAQIGFNEVARSLPSNPAVYLLYVAIYLLAPVCEALFFGICWNLPWREGFLVFCRKHVYNQEVFDFAGEVYLYGWARKNLSLTERDAFRPVKDNAILSSISANVTLLTVPAITMALGLLAVASFPAWVRRGLYLGPVAAVAILAILFALRKKVFGLPGPLLLTSLGINCTRQLLWMLLASLQWWVALSDHSLQFVWTIIVVQQFAGRIPPMPFRDALFIAIGVSASQGIGGPAAQVAGLLLVNTLLEKSLNLALYSTSLFRREAPIAPPTKTAFDAVNPAFEPSADLHVCQSPVSKAA